jgi:hypothetical protein
MIGDLDMAAHIETLERKVVASDITIRELEEQLKHARACRDHAAQLVEAKLRELNVTDVRLWGAPWRTGLSGNVASVTLTLREGKGEVHGETLEDAIGRAMKEQGAGT